MRHRVLTAIGRLGYASFFVIMACAYTYALVILRLLAGRLDDIKTPPCTVDTSSPQRLQNGRCFDNAWNFHAQPIDWMISAALAVGILVLVIRYASAVANGVIDGINWLVGDLFDPTKDAYTQEDYNWRQEADRVIEDMYISYPGNTL